MSDCNRCFVRSTIYTERQCIPPFGGFELKIMGILVVVVKNQFGTAKWSAPCSRAIVSYGIEELGFVALSRNPRRMPATGQSVCRARPG